MHTHAAHKQANLQRAERATQAKPKSVLAAGGGQPGFCSFVPCLTNQFLMFSFAEVNIKNWGLAKDKRLQLMRNRPYPSSPHMVPTGTGKAHSYMLRTRACRKDMHPYMYLAHARNQIVLARLCLMKAVGAHLGGHQ